MGVGIAYVSAMAGATVTVVEPDQSRALAFNRTVDETVLSSIARGKMGAAGGDALRSRIERVTTVEQVPLVADVAIETVSAAKTVVVRDVSRALLEVAH